MQLFSQRVELWGSLGDGCVVFVSTIAIHVFVFMCVWVSVMYLCLVLDMYKIYGLLSGTVFSCFVPATHNRLANSNQFEYFTKSIDNDKIEWHGTEWQLLLVSWMLFWRFSTSFFSLSIFFFSYFNLIWFHTESIHWCQNNFMVIKAFGPDHEKKKKKKNSII